MSHLDDKTKDLEARIATIKQMGGHDAVEKQHASG